MQEILEVANYLALGDIVNLCSAYMMANMELDNAMEVLALADSLGLGRLRDRAASFICANFQAREGILSIYFWAVATFFTIFGSLDHFLTIFWQSKKFV